MNIISKLPYGKDFLYVDEILEVSDQHIYGKYFFSEDLAFYASHFRNHPVTPGVILTECSAQIGLACFGIHLTSHTKSEENKGVVVLSEVNINFLKPVYPNETVWVRAELIYFRFNKLKVNVELSITNNIVVAKGIISGMLTK